MKHSSNFYPILIALTIHFTLCNPPSTESTNLPENPSSHTQPHVEVVPNQQFDPLENLANQMIHDIFEGGDNGPKIVTKTVTHDPIHHKTVTKTSGPGFESVVVTEVVGPGQHGIGGGIGDPVIIPIFRQPRRIHLKKVSGEENPFKVFKELDQIFESFLDGFAKGFDQDNKKRKKKQKKSKKERDELKKKIEEMDKKINSEDSIVVTNIRDITNEVKDENLPAVSPQQLDVIHQDIQKEEIHSNSSEKQNESPRFKETIKDSQNNNKNKKEVSTFAKVMKYVIYFILIGLGLFIGKVILSKMNDPGLGGAAGGSSAEAKPVSNVSTDPGKPKSEMKLMREDKNKYY